MDYELKKETIKTLCPTEGAAVQLVIDGDLIVPDMKGDISYIVWCRTDAAITEKNIFDGRISFKGKMYVQLIYVTEGDNTLSSMKGVFLFEDFINIDGINGNDYINIVPVTEHVEYKKLNSRKAAVKCIVLAMATAEKRCEAEISTQCTGESGLNVKTTEIPVKLTEAVIDYDFKISEEMNLPSSKGDIDDVVYSSAKIIDSDIKAFDGGINVSGNIKVKVIYINMDSGTMAESVEFEIPFDGSVENASVKSEDIVCGNVFIKSYSINIVTDNEGHDRVVSLEADMAVNAESVEEIKVEAVLDAYSDKTCVETETEYTKYPVFLGKNKNKTVVKETIKADENDILKLVDAESYISYYDIKTEKNSVTVNAIAEVELLVITENDNRPYGEISASVPFSQNVEISGVDENSVAEGTVRIDNIQVNILNSREAEVSIFADIEICAQKMDSCICIDQIKPCEKTADTPSAAIYVVQSGDTLWDIAKRYQTAQKNIIDINNLENENVKQGEKLLIIKKVEI